MYCQRGISGKALSRLDHNLSGLIQLSGRRRGAPFGLTQQTGEHSPPLTGACSRPKQKTANRHSESVDNGLVCTKVVLPFVTQ